MDFFSELGKTLDNVINQVGEKSEEIWESGKANLEIVKQEDAIKRMYRKIGKLVSEDFAQGQLFSNEINEACAEVQERKNVVEELKSKLRKSKNSEKNTDSSTVEDTDQAVETDEKSDDANDKS
ncbi:MAG: hypothetical protein GX783_05205 [Clostridiales bacterium]|nr:hypothetical protein [Clostridiales bacterium]